jgi:hypothetical protein
MAANTTASPNELLKSALDSIQDLESNAHSFFALLNNAIETPYEPTQAIDDYTRILNQVETLEATIGKLGLSGLAIPEGKSLEDILKGCSIASASAYKSASSIEARAKLAQKSIQDANHASST